MKININFKLILFVFFVIFLILSVFIFFRYYKIIGIKLNNSEIKSNKEIEKIVNAKCMEYNNELLLYNDNKLLTYNKNNKKTWEHNLVDTENCNIYVKGKYIVVQNLSTIYIFNNKKEIANKKINGEIKNIFLDNSGNIIVVYSSTKYKTIISIINKNGEEKNSINLDLTTISNIELIDNCTKLMIFEIDTSSITAGNKISIIDLKNNSNKLIAKIDNNIVFDYSLNKNELIVLTNKTLEKYDFNGNLTLIENLSETQTNYIAISKNKYYATIKSENNKYKFNTIRFDKVLISTTELNKLPKYIKNNGDLTYIVSDDKIIVINKWGIRLKDINVNIAPNDIIIFDNETTIALVYQNKIELVNI